MINLKKPSSLPLGFSKSRLIFSRIPEVKPKFRLLRDMKMVLYDKNCKLKDNEIIYIMYRGVSKSQHAKLFKKHSLRYDITIILPKMLGKEFPKTLGHYHSICKKISYPEIYEVLYGKAHYLIQSTEGKRVKDVAIIKAEEGEIVIVPPNYGHITINVSKKPLIACNLNSIKLTSIYGPIKNLKGACYYETLNKFVKNKNYTHIPKLRILKAKNIKKLFLGSKRPIYDQFVKSPAQFNFLNNPEKYYKEMLRMIKG